MRSNRRLWLLVLLAAVAAAPAVLRAGEELIWKDGKWVPAAPPQEGSAAGELAMIRQDVEAGRHKQAIQQAKKFLKRYPATKLREEAMLLAGEAEMARDRYWVAHGWYDRQLTAYPAGPLSERALDREMEIAQAFLAGRKRRVAKLFKVSGADDGLEILEGIAQRAPRSDRAQQALLTIADHYFRKGDWETAAESYDNFLKLFSKSPRAAYAELRAAESYRLSYRGADYDETPLVEAEQRYKAFADHYPQKLPQTRVRQILAEIRSQRAAKQYRVAQFYLRTGRPEAAGHYLKTIVVEYGDTEYAEQAFQYLAQVDPATASRLGRPPGPPAAPPDGAARSGPTTAPAEEKKESP